MYGFGTYLVTALKKMTFTVDKPWLSRFKKERKRQDAIISMTKDALKDEHKTDIHRIHALIKEYENDLKDPNISKEVKEEMKEDIGELKKVLNEYLNHFDSFQAKVYKLIDEELTKMEKSSNINESVEYFEEKSHSKLKYDFRKAYDWNTGHSLKLVYSLDNIEVTDIGTATTKNMNEKEKKNHIGEVQNNIKKKGHTDHKSSGQKLLAIVDRVTNKNLKDAEVIGPFAPNIPNGELDLSDELEDLHDFYNSKGKEFKNRYINKIRVGEIDTSSTFKSTHWFNNDISSKKNRAGIEYKTDNTISRGTQAETLGYGRGAKLNDIKSNVIDIVGDSIKYNHPSKKDKRKNPDLYKESEYAESFEETSLLDLEIDIPPVITESEKDEFSISSSEREEFYKIFGKSLDCSLAKDKNGYYVRTHRCRSKSYKEIKDIPKKSVDFVRSTS